VSHHRRLSVAVATVRSTTSVGIGAPCALHTCKGSEDDVTSTAAERNLLHNTMSEHIGERAAGILMDHLPPTGWADVATKQDVAHLEAKTDLRFEELDRRLNARFEAIEHRFEAIDHRFDEVIRRFDQLKDVFVTRDDLHAMTSRYIGWMLASQASFFTAVALLVMLR
jgi:hypothetical protein